jgi:hypothetical protein
MSRRFNRTPSPTEQRRLVLVAGITALLVLLAMAVVLYAARRGGGSA